jgi:golgi phosphoprotein 3
MQLNTVEKFLLITHHPEKGRFIVSGIQMEYGIIGALLLDMTLENKIVLEKDMLILNKNWKSDNQVLSEISSLISKSDRPRTIKHWLSIFARRSNKYKWLVLTELVNKKTISIENKKIMGIIPYRKSYLTETYTRSNLIQQLKNNILFHKDLSNEAVAILGMIEACKIHKIITSEKDELRRLKAELKQVTKDSPIASMVDQTIRQVQAAILAAMVASMAASSAASHH